MVNDVQPDPVDDVVDPGQRMLVTHADDTSGLGQRFARTRRAQAAPGGVLGRPRSAATRAPGGLASHRLNLDGLAANP
jgi:hypothetical protein